MLEKTLCPKCGNECPLDTNYCAYCGHELKFSSDETVDRFFGFIRKLTPIHLLVLGLILMAILGSLSEYLMVSKLSFGISVFLMLSFISGGLAYLGWKYHSRSSIREYAMRMLIVFACMGLSLVIVLLLDRLLLILSVSGDEMVFYRLPGIYVASAIGTRRVTIESAPPYWLIVLAYGVVVFVVGYFALHLRNAIEKIAY